jgi:asparagine synthase (glutamine-hydrolysing)
MCGIGGLVGSSPKKNKLLKSMLFHRGPDDSGEYLVQDIDLTLIHTRLAIQDKLGGSQPMHWGTYVIVMNGEIYNHMELRNEISDVTFRTSSDIETFLALYDKFGVESLNRMDGMFAIAIYNHKEKELTLIRDRAGKKPLYYFNNISKFAFASELKSLQAVCKSPVHDRNVGSFLYSGQFYGSETPYVNIEEVPPGSFIKINYSKMTINMERWWSIESSYKQSISVPFNEALEEVENRLEIAIKNRLISSDLEVGTFLSGGIDSGLITAISAKHQATLKTFTVRMPGSYDEGPLAKLVSNRYGTNHTEIEIDFESIQDDVKTILALYGEPFADPSAIPSYYVSREAKKHLTVILNGDGADELFGGYRRYVPFSKYDFFDSSNAIKMLSNIFRMISLLPKERQSGYNYLYRLAGLSASNPYECYLAATTERFSGIGDQAIYSGTGEFKSLVDRIALETKSGLAKILLLDFLTLLPDTLLVKMDISTMAFALEGRSPFLSKELLEYVPSLPDKYKISGKQTKPLLRRLATKYLPASLIDQPKRGFEIPLEDWVDGNLKGLIFDYLGGSESYVSQHIENKTLRTLLSKNNSISRPRRARLIWRLLATEIWYKSINNY